MTDESQGLTTENLPLELDTLCRTVYARFIHTLKLNERPWKVSVKLPQPDRISITSTSPDAQNQYLEKLLNDTQLNEDLASHLEKHLEGYRQNWSSPPPHL